MKGLIDMVEWCGLKFEGRKHSGKDDTLNMARVARHLVENGYEFTRDMVKSYH